MKNKSLIVFVCSVLLSLIFTFIYIYDNSKLIRLNIPYEEKNNTNIEFNIEKVNLSSDYVEITGWAIDKGKTYDYFNWVNGDGSSVYINNTVVLEDSNGTYFLVNTTSCERKDINSEINDGIDYKKCGMHAAVRISKLKKNETYKIGILLKDPNGEENLVMSNEEFKI